MDESPLALSERVKISVSLGESHFREFKSALQGPPGAKTPRATKAICKDVGEALVAFANADGGELLVGVEDNGEITGIDHLPSSEIDKIKQASRSHVFDRTPIPNVRVVTPEYQGKTVISFLVTKSSSYIHQTADGRCLIRNDLETIPFSAEDIRFDRQEILSREYDRQFVDGATVKDLDTDLLEVVSDQISKGMSNEKCLQYLGLAEFGGPEIGIRLRKAALLLFARDISKWHPRSQVRMMKVNGTSVGTGASYNITSDEVISSNVCKIIDLSWEKLRQYLVHTILHEDARFKQTFMYPENACREALVNAVAHRDYSNEGGGIEIFIFDDRIEFRNPGALLSSIKIQDIRELRGVHQSRNSYVARTLRELGFMRELGEGLRRIFELMKTNELAPPEIESNNSYFHLKMHHKPMYSKDELLWLGEFDELNLTPQQKSVILLGRAGDLVEPQDIIDRVGIVDIEEYRKLLHSLQSVGILISEVPKATASRLAKSKKIGVRSIPRFKIIKPKERIERSTPKTTGKRNNDNSPIDSAENDASERSGVSVYIGNLPQSVNSMDMYDLLESFGEILDVRLPRFGKFSKGYGFVEFIDQESADKAIKMSGRLIMGGRPILIKKSYR